MRTGGCCRFDDVDVDDGTLLFLMKARTNVFVVGDVHLQFDGIGRKNLVVAATGGDDNDHHHHRRCWCCYYCYEDDHHHHHCYCFHTG